MADRGVRALDEAMPESQVEAARRGDPAAIEAVLRAHVRQVHAICARLCRDPGDAEDAAQEALLSVARGLERFDGRSKLSSWVYRITTNACMDELRRRRRRPDPADPTDLPELAPEQPSGDSPEEAALASDTRAILAAALEQIPEDFRVAVVLRDVADLDYATIAETTGVPVGTVRSRIARGRSALAEILDRGTDPPLDPSETVDEPVADAHDPGTGPGT